MMSARDYIDSFASAIADAGIRVPPTIIADGAMHRFPTNEKRGDTAGWYVLHLDGLPAGSFGCHRAGISCTWRAEGTRAVTRADRIGLASLRAEQEARREREATAKRLRAIAIWNAAADPRGTLAEAYLRGRALRLPCAPVLRFAPSLQHPQGLWLPALVALVQGADGDPIGIHRTYLNLDGNGKACVEPAKAMLGRCGGGAVRLAEPSAGRLLVGEGIETTLSAMQVTGCPGWAALSAGGVEALVLPRDVRAVTVLADADPRGVAAAREAADRWTFEGRRVDIATPPDGLDFNDVLRVSNLEVAS